MSGFGITAWNDNASNGPTSVDMNYASIAALLKTGSKSAWTQVFASTSGDTVYVYLEWAKTSVSATDTHAAIDIGVGGAGSESVVIPDVFVGFTDDPNANNGIGGYGCWSGPLAIAAGSRVSVRGVTIRGADQAISLRVSLLSSPASGTNPYKASTVSLLGASGGPPVDGVSITPGNDSTWSSWTTIGTLGADCRALVPQVRPVLTASAVQRNAYQLQLGVSSSPVSHVFDFHVGSSETITPLRPTLPAYVGLASGSVIQARLRGVSGSIDAMKVAVHAFSKT